MAAGIVSRGAGRFRVPHQTGSRVANHWGHDTHAGSVLWSSLCSWGTCMFGYVISRQARRPGLPMIPTVRTEVESAMLSINR